MTQNLTREDHERILGDYFRPKLVSLSRDKAALAGLGGVQTRQKFWDWAIRNFYIAETKAPIKPFPHQRVIMRLMFEYALEELHCQTLIYSTIKKCLVPETIVQTPNGVTHLGSLKVGDFVYDENMQPTKVTAVSGLQYDRRCYGIVLSDGSSFIADGEHKWPIRRYGENNYIELTTEEMLLSSAQCSLITTPKSAGPSVVSITSLKSVPVCCITVESPSHIFLVGDYIPTCNSGKTAVGAAVARWAAETWGAYGEVFTLANSLDQAKGRTYAAVIESLELDPRYDRMAREIPGLWRVTDKAAVYIPENSVITPIANSHKGAAGSNPSISVYSELWGYNSGEDKRLWAEMAPSPIRQKSVRFVETYAGYDGESEILQNLYKIVTEEGRRLTQDDVPDWPFPDDFAPDPAFNRADPRHVSQLPFYVNENAGIFAYWDEGEHARRMPWQLGERGQSYYRQESATQTPEEFERLHLNRWTAGVASFIPPEWFEACRVNEREGAHYFGVPTNESTPVVVAADASVSGDCTGLTMQRRDPRDPTHVITCAAKEWRPSKGHPLNYSLTIEPELRKWVTGHTHPRDQHCDDHTYVAELGVCIPSQPHNVVQVTYDQYQLHDLMTRLTMEQIAWCKPFSQNADRMIADKLLYDLIVTRRWHHLGDPILREHFMGAARKVEKDSNSKMRLIKKSQTSKIDLAVCVSMGASECLRLMIG